MRRTIGRAVVTTGWRSVCSRDARCGIVLSLSAPMGVTLQNAAQHAEPLFCIFRPGSLSHPGAASIKRILLIAIIAAIARTRPAIGLRTALARGGLRKNKLCLKASIHSCHG